MLQQGRASHKARSHFPTPPPFTDLLNKVWLITKLVECARTSLAPATLFHFPQACVQGLVNIFKAWSCLGWPFLVTFERSALSMSVKHRIKAWGRSEYCLPTLSLTSRLRPRRLLSRWCATGGCCCKSGGGGGERRRWRKHDSMDSVESMVYCQVAMTATEPLPGPVRPLSRLGVGLVPRSCCATLDVCSYPARPVRQEFNGAVPQLPQDAIPHQVEDGAGFFSWAVRPPHLQVCHVDRSPRACCMPCSLISFLEKRDAQIAHAMRVVQIVCAVLALVRSATS